MIATFLAWPGAKHPHVRAGLRPGPRQIRMRQIRMRQCLALVTVEQHDIASFGLALTQLQVRGRCAPPRGRFAATSACAGAAASETFFSQRLGQLRTADTHARTRLDRTHLELWAKPGDRPVWPVGYGFFEQGCCHTQRCFTFHRRRPRPRCWPAAHQHRHAQSRCATGGRCLHARKTPRRCADWSSPRA